MLTDPALMAGIVFGIAVVYITALVLAAAWHGEFGHHEPRPRRRSQAEIWRDDAHRSPGRSNHLSANAWPNVSVAGMERQRMEAAIEAAKADYAAGRTDRATFEAELDLFLADLDKLESIR